MPISIRRIVPWGISKGSSLKPQCLTFYVVFVDVINFITFLLAYGTENGQYFIFNRK